MSEIIDLDLLVSEPVSFKIGNEIYKVPTDLETGILLKVSKLEQKIIKSQQSKEIEKALSLQDDLVFILMSELNEVTKEWVGKLHNSQKIAILNHYRNRVNELNQDPNFSSLPSQQ